LVRLEIYRTECWIYKQRLRMSGFAHGTILRMLGGNELAHSTRRFNTATRQDPDSDSIHFNTSTGQDHDPVSIHYNTATGQYPNSVSTQVNNAKVQDPDPVSVCVNKTTGQDPYAASIRLYNTHINKYTDTYKHTHRDRPTSRQAERWMYLFYSLRRKANASKKQTHGIALLCVCVCVCVCHFQL